MLFLVTCLSSQKKNDQFRLNIKPATGPITIDGVGDDSTWSDTDVAKDFFMVLPMDDGPAVNTSEIRMAYDDTNIYLLAIFYNEQKGKNFVESLRRDFAFGKNDNFLLFMDPFNNQTTGFSFGSNAAGAQWDGTMFAGGKIDLNWDTKWISEVKQNDEKWVFEMALPFKSIRYEAGVTEWGINFSRLDLKSSEKSSWTPIPRQFPTASLAYTGTLVWDKPPPPPGINYSIIPYVLGNVSQDLENNKNSEYEVKVGGDVKFSLTSSLNLDLTINPDFSQVEVDRQVTNLDRFELFFPERRQFFLENSDLFANFGYDNIRPFFSRRIGLGVPIDAGARISGNLNENWRVGLLNMQTSSIDATGLPSQNFGVLSLQRKVFKRSNIGLMFVNKQSINYPTENDSVQTLYPKFNRNLGVEYNLASSNNLWNGKAFFLKSFGPGQKGNGVTQAANIDYNSRKWNWRFQLISHGPGLNFKYFFNESFKQTDRTNFLVYNFNFINRSNLFFFISDDYVELLSPFDPTRLGKEELATGTKHSWNAFGWEFNSRPQSLFTYNFTGRLGGYYLDGNRTSLSTELGYRFQPYVSISANVNYNHINLPEPWNKSQFWLVGSEVDITFTNKVFFSNLFQYNEQTGNLNVNSRFQWRYSPASDLFLVYTNNYFIEPYASRNWGLTLKFTYWLNK